LGLVLVIISKKQRSVWELAHAPCPSPDRSGKPGKALRQVCLSADRLSVTTEAQLCAGLAAQPNKSNYPLLFWRLRAKL